MVPCSNVVDFRGHFLYFTTGYRHGFLVKYGYHVQRLTSLGGGEQVKMQKGHHSQVLVVVGGVDHHV